MINIAHLEKAAVFAALYNAARPQGMGFLHYDATPMTLENAREYLALTGSSAYFDYVKGRVMKVSLEGDEFNPSLYDRDNGPGAAERALASLEQGAKVDNEEIQQAHLRGTQAAISELKSRLGEPSTVEKQGDTTVLTLGLADMAGHLAPALERATKFVGEQNADRGLTTV